MACNYHHRSKTVVRICFVLNQFGCGTERLKEKVIARHNLNDEAKAKTREVKQLEQDIKEILKEAESKKISADWGSVSMYSQKAPMRYDVNKFKEAGLDHRDFQTQGDYSPRLSITYRT